MGNVYVCCFVSQTQLACIATVPSFTTLNAIWGWKCRLDTHLFLGYWSHKDHLDGEWGRPPVAVFSEVEDAETAYALTAVTSTFVLRHPFPAAGRCVP